MYITDGKGVNHIVRKGDEVFIDPKTFEVVVVPPERQYQPKYCTRVDSLAEPTKGSYFEQALTKISEMHRAKQEDYTDTNEFANFEEAAQEGDITTLQFLNSVIGNKSSRIRVLERKAKQGRVPRNESLEDSYLDRAVYALISYARYLYEKDAGIPASAYTGDDTQIKIPQPGGELICRECGHGYSKHETIIQQSCSCCDQGLLSFNPIKK